MEDEVQYERSIPSDWKIFASTLVGTVAGAASVTPSSGWYAPRRAAGMVLPRMVGAPGPPAYEVSEKPRPIQIICCAECDHSIH